MYPWQATAAEIAAHYADEQAQAELFDTVMVEELSRWIALADERMSEYGIDVFVMPGNDDPWSCDAPLEHAAHVIACDDRLVQLGPHEMISCAYANPTPWNSPRELDEDALYTRIKRLADQVEAPDARSSICTSRPMTRVSTARELDADLTVLHGGAAHEIPVGSSAVRQIIEEYQPVLAVHGHIHESPRRGAHRPHARVNPGSEYNSGRIHGLIARFAGDEIVSHQLVVG